MDSPRQDGARGSECLHLSAADALSGSIDDLLRPFIRIDVFGFDDPVVAFIDTGFNGAVIVDEQQAERMGFVVLARQYIDVRLASLRKERFQLATGALAWFGEKRNISAFVLARSERSRTAGSGEEEILIGTELLRDCRLQIDFPHRSVRIVKA
jgi:predicted aspartyl protease